MTGTAPLRLGTRRSALARAQAGTVARALQDGTGRGVELVDVVTFGDVSAAPLEQIGGTGVFVSALRERLLAGDIDLAVHSLKDLPTAPAPGLALAAVPAREDPRDVLVGARLAELRPGARIGTGAPRRVAQLRGARPDLEFVAIRGNVDTRLRRVADGELDAVVLARAGLARLGRLDAVTEILDPAIVLPAPGQGALAVECRGNDPTALAAAAPLDSPPTRTAVTAERALLAALEAGCTAPVGALASVGEGSLTLTAVAAGADGSPLVRSSVTGPLDDAAGLGRSLAAALLAAGAAYLQESARELRDFDPAV